MVGRSPLLASPVREALKRYLLGKESWDKLLESCFVHEWYHEDFHVIVSCKWMYKGAYHQELVMVISMLHATMSRTAILHIPIVIATDRTLYRLLVANRIPC